MPTIINNRSQLTTDPIRNFRFLVTFTPHDTNAAWHGKDPVTLGFTSVSGLSVTTDSIPYREGGYNTTVHQIPGQTTFAPISLQRGVIINTKQNWEWMRTLFATVQGGSKNAVGASFRADVEIAVLSHPIPGSAGGNNATGAGAVNVNASDDHVSMRFKVYNCWPTSVAYSDLNAGDNALFVEAVTLVHEGFDIKWATGLGEGTTAASF